MALPTAGGAIQVQCSPNMVKMQGYESHGIDLVKQIPAECFRIYSHYLQSTQVVSAIDVVPLLVE